MKHTQTRIFVVLAILSLLSLSVFLVIKMVDSNKQSKLYEYNDERFSEMISLSMDRQFSVIQRIVFDYSYWDEVILCIKNHDEFFFNEQIAPVTKPQPDNLSSLSQLDYVWLTNEQNEVVFQFGNYKLGGDTAHIPLGAYIYLKEKKFITFTIHTPAGYMLVSGATVHSSDDIERKKNSHGFLFMGKLLDQDFIKEFSQQSMASMRIILPSEYKNGSDDDFTFMRTAHPLTDYRGKTISYIDFQREFVYAKLLYKYSNLTLALLIALILGFLVTFYFTSKFFITKPLGLVMNALESSNPEDLALLKRQKSEFGKIGVLLENYLQQKNDLIHARQRAEESDKLKTAFLANMSHEIRTPMNGILGFTELLKDNDIGEDLHDEYVNIIQRSGQNLLHIINDIIDISKIESGQMQIIESEISINEVVRDVYGLFNNDPKIQQGIVQFQINLMLNDASSYELSDQVRLSQILTNLTSNALKFTQAGYVQIGYRILNDDHIEFFVKDSGIGIAEDKLDIIFDRFVQVDIGATRTYEGAGLGLSISKALAELMGGKIDVQSTLGVGTEFTFRIPLKLFTKEIEQTHPKKITEAFPDFSKRKILISDDIEENYLFLYYLLNPSGASIDWAKNGKECVEMCESTKYDIVLMDLRMPVMNGYDATRILKSKYPDLIIIAQTAYSLDSDHDKSIAAGCDGYISKPINAKDLINLVKKFLPE